MAPGGSGVTVSYTVSVHVCASVCVREGGKKRR